MQIILLGYEHYCDLPAFFRATLLSDREAEWHAIRILMVHYSPISELMCFALQTPTCQQVEQQGGPSDRIIKDR